MDIRPIRTKADHRAALREISALMEADPIEAIRFRMEQLGLTAKDLAASIGKTHRVYEVLNHKRGLTLPMIRKLHAQLDIPAETLIREPGQA